ncbi:DUF883 family protein [Nevskia soli]|uniref:DUF883 family protein n=1 Tax=Nevskia soli TaxID=418856 RepID=UPI0006899FFD|nr:DUF883 family protein [Nevskia soli]
MEAHTGNGASRHSREVSKAAQSVGESSSALTQEFNNFVTDIEDLIKSSASLSGEELSKAKDKIKQRIDSAKEAFGETTENVTARARKAVAATHQYVSEEPWKAVGVGAAVGFLLGVAVARRPQ